MRPPQIPTCPLAIFVVRGWNRTTGTRRFKSLLYLLSYRTNFEVENLCVVKIQIFLITYFSDIPFSREQHHIWYCDAVADNHTRFTIYCQQVYELNEFTFSYHHNILKIGQGRSYVLSCIPSQELPITSGFVVTLSNISISKNFFPFVTGVGTHNSNLPTPAFCLTKICNLF